MSDDKKKNPIHDEAAHAIIDKHMEAIMSELAGIGIRAIGVVAGVLHQGETAVSWCVNDGTLGRDGKPAPIEVVAHEIAADMEKATRTPA